jgi:hypothetical protein
MNQQKGHNKRLLFLKQYEGPVTQNAFIVTGVYQGNFKIDKNDKLVYDADQYGGYQSFQAELEQASLSSAEEKVTNPMKRNRESNKKMPPDHSRSDGVFPYL